MLVKFRSKAAADVTMYEEHAKRVLDLLGKDVNRGIITAAEAPDAIARLEAEIVESKTRPKQEEAQRGDEAQRGEGEGEDDDDKEQASRQYVSFATRVFPLLDMLRAAQKGKYDVMWGIW